MTIKAGAATYETTQMKIPKLPLDAETRTRWLWFAKDCKLTVSNHEAAALSPINLHTDRALLNFFLRSPLQFQAQLIEGIVGIAKEVEAAFGGVPQDIEGVYADGKFTVVQSRPQIL